MAGFSVKHQELLTEGTFLEFSKLLTFLRAFLLKEHNEDGTHITDNPTSGVAPATVAYVTIGNTSSLSAERALVGTTNQITVTDGGAGGNVVLAAPQSIAATSSPTFAGLTVSNLTSGRVPIAGASGVLADDADLTFATDTLTATKLVGTTSVTTAALTDSGLTSGRVVVATTGGLLADDADLTFSVDTLTAKGLVVGTTKLTSYDGIAAAGYGTSVIRGSGRAAAQTAAVAAVATFTVGAADASFLISTNVLVTTATAHNFTVTCDYTDEGNTARTLTLSFSNLAGTFLQAITNVTGAGPYEGIPLHIRAKSATTITIATTGTFTTVTYNVEGLIQQVA